MFPAEWCGGFVSSHCMFSSFVRAERVCVCSGSSDRHRGASLAQLRVRAAAQPVGTQHQTGGETRKQKHNLHMKVIQ